MYRKERENPVKDLDRTDVLHSKASQEIVNSWDRGVILLWYRVCLEPIGAIVAFKQVKRYSD